MIEKKLKEALGVFNNTGELTADKLPQSPLCQAVFGYA